MKIFNNLNNKDEFNEINIDDVLREAEAALKAAENSLDDGQDKAETASLSSSFLGSSGVSTNDDDSLTQQQQQQSEKDLTDIIASAMGGILFGLLLGSFFSFQPSASIVTSTLETVFGDDIPRFFVVPILTAIVFGVAGLIGSLQDNSVGIITRSLFAFPVLTLVSAILEGFESFVESTQQAARQQVENAANDIKALPGKIANSAQQTTKRAVESAVEEVTSIPRKAKEKVVESSIQAVDTVKSSVNSVVEEVSSLPRKAKDTVLDSLSKEFLLAVILIPAVIAIGLLLVDNIVAGKIQL
jgi:hypothetical protein